MLLFWVIAPVVAFNFLFARHSKAFFLALDHYFDPHQKDESDGDEGGNIKEPPVSPKPSAPQSTPSPEPAVLV
jgi:hypothetical protein